jgi:hypothetical protein
MSPDSEKKGLTMNLYLMVIIVEVQLAFDDVQFFHLHLNHHQNRYQLNYLYHQFLHLFLIQLMVEV